MRMLLTILILTGSLIAEDNKEKKRELPKSGVLAVTALTEGVPIEPTWGEDGSGEKAPLAGNVIRKDGKWEASLVNQSDKDTYYALISVEFKNKAGTLLNSQRFAFTLKPGERVTRPVSGSPSADVAQVKLESWKNLSEKPKKKEIVKEEAAETQTWTVGSQ
jgi:hypothetical protein